MMVPLQTITNLLDSTLRINEIKDAPGAMNGLQVENNGHVTKVAVAVDGSQETIDAAIAAQADLLVLHHGIYWCGLRPMTGWFRKKIVSCLESNLAVYAAHLPLDMHPALGNNACIAKALGLADCRPEICCYGEMIGVSGLFNGSVGELREHYAAITCAPVTGYVQNPGAPAGRVAICSGAGGDEIYQLQAKGYGTYLTGEENHWVSYTAADIGLNVLFAGHYATETFGVKAIARLLNERFGLPAIFIDKPTGM